MTEEQAVSEQVKEETTVAPEDVNLQETPVTPPPAPPAKTHTDAEYKGLQKSMASKDREIEATKSQLSVLLRQGQDTGALRDELATLRLEIAEMYDAYTGQSQTPEEVIPLSRVERLKAQQAERAAKAQPQPMTESDRAAETIRALLKKANIEPTDPLLAPMVEAWGSGDFTGAVEDVRQLATNTITASEALAEEGISLSSDEAKEVREALKTGNTRKINRAVEKLIDKKVEAGNAEVETENARKAEFKVITKSPSGTVTLSIPKDPEKRREWVAGLSQEDFEKVALQLNELRRTGK